MRRCIIIFILCSIILATIGTATAEEFKVGIYYDNPTHRIAGFDEMNTTTHNILVVRDLNTKEVLPQFSVTGASSNWDKMENTSGSQIHFYPDMLDMYNLTGNPNLYGLWLGLGVVSNTMKIKYISKTPITQDDFLVQIGPWSDYGAEDGQSRGLYFDYVDMNHTYLVRINGDNAYLLEDLSTGEILAAGTFSGDNYNPNINLFLEVSDLTGVSMHVKAYTTISPAPYERLFFNGTLSRQAVTPPANETINTTVIYNNTTKVVRTDKGVTNYYTNNTVVYQNITYLNQTIVYENESVNDTVPKIKVEDNPLVFGIFLGIVLGASIMGCAIVVCYYVILRSKAKR